MKILHAILTGQFYGSERYCAELAALQASYGHDVRVIVQNSSAPFLLAFGEAIAPNGTIANSAAPSPARPGAAELVIMPSWLPSTLHRSYARRTLSEFFPDVVHSHLDPAARRVGKVAQRLGIPHVATLHLDYHPDAHGGCDGLICVAEWQRASVGPEFTGEVAVVHNWLPVQVAQAITAVGTEASAVLRQSWNAGANTMVFGSVGRLLPEKGMDVLVEAFRQAFARGDEDVRLVLVGDGPQRGAAAELAGGDRRIVFAGWHGDVAAFYQAFDVYVSAARFEPFGLTILEAMAAACPLILTRAQGPREFVRDPRARWCTPGEIAPLADLMLKEVERRRRRLEYDLSALSPALAVTAIEGHYRKVIARRHAAIRTPAANR